MLELFHILHHKQPAGLMPECRRLRDLFLGKEVIGQKIEDCGEKHPYPNPRIPKRTPAKREEYIHDTQTDLWYHCCEYRPMYGKFAIDAELPRTKKEMKGKIKEKIKGYIGKFFGADEGGIPDTYEEPKGPLLQCNMMQNMKHRQDDDNGGRMVTDKVFSEALGSLTGLGSTPCIGDEAVALKRYSGGKSQTYVAGILGTDDIGTCIDQGPPGSTTPHGKPYHVFELSAPLPPLLPMRNTSPFDPGELPRCFDVNGERAPPRIYSWWRRHTSHFL